MTIKELIEILKGLPQDLPIILQKDAEGNGYSPLSGLGETWYVAETTWAGECYSDEDVEEFKDGAQKAVCFWPVN